MSATKLSISLDAELANEVREAATSAGMSVSAWIAEAVKPRLCSVALDRFLQEWEAEHGPFTPEELARADADLGFGPEQTEAAGA